MSGVGFVRFGCECCYDSFPRVQCECSEEGDLLTHYDMTPPCDYHHNLVYVTKLHHFICSSVYYPLLIRDSDSITMKLFVNTQNLLNQYI